MHSYKPHKSDYRPSPLDRAAYEQFIREAYDHDNNDGLHALLRQAIEEDLTERQKEIVLLYYYDGYKMQDIAHKLGVCPSTISRTIAASKVKLRRCLKYGAKKLLNYTQND